MNENNLEYLQNTLKYLGFGDSLNADLKESIAHGPVGFKIQSPTKEMPDPAKRYEPEFGDKMTYVLSFSKSKETDMYFFNSYEATLKKADTKDLISQTFYINKGKGVTAKESYNLLSGRAVNKDVVLKSGEKANLWLKLDFTEHTPEKGYAIDPYGKNYGFSLKETVETFHILNMEKLGFKDQLLKSLERGNLHEVSFMKNGKEVTGFVTANPKFKTLDFYDRDLGEIYSKAVDRKEPVLKEEKEKEYALEGAIEPKVEEKKGRGR
ncbi:MULTISPECIES: hypothetical protein [Pedobacter]|uniref:DUF3945 domain-containing protein n=1 Tax=Pedobacter suwonensis TaxID=332999 RepID=A0A1I0TT72_9SPHI|nr:MULTISPECIES: hypothetical protein [Pedobacter]SFA54932.1 hypothetical protein SAMN04488511_11445 [Pedobacter suwonensis]